MAPMGNTRNLTVRLDEAVIQKARIVAARRGSSISRLVAEAIEAMASNEDIEYEQAMREALKLMDHGIDLGGPPYLTRDEAHER